MIMRQLKEIRSNFDRVKTDGFIENDFDLLEEEEGGDFERIWLHPSKPVL